MLAFMIKWILFSIAVWGICALCARLLVIPSAYAEEELFTQQIFRDSAGRTVVTTTQSGNVTTYRDSAGRTIGTGTTDSAGTTVFRDDRGRTTGSISLGSKR